MTRRINESIMGAPSFQGLFLGLFLVVLVSVPIPAHSKPLDGYVFVSGYYDDNIFNYSDADRETFKNRSGSLERFPIESLDDFVLTPAARGDYLWEVRRHSNWRIRAQIDGRLHLNNTSRNYARMGLSLRRRSRRGSVEFSLGYTPNYYLRHLYWRPMPNRPVGVRFAAARFDKYSIQLSARRDLSRKTSGLAELEFARRNYDFPFDERDNSTVSLTAGVRHETSRVLRIELEGSSAWCAAKGPSGVPGALADVSNNQYGVRAGLRWKFSRGWRLVETLAYTHQGYTSNDPADVAHYDRKDHDVDWSNRLYWRIDRNWQAQLYYRHRSSSTSVSAPLYFDVGQYTAQRVGMQVNYFF